MRIFPFPDFSKECARLFVSRVDFNGLFQVMLRLFPHLLDCTVFAHQGDGNAIVNLAPGWFQIHRLLEITDGSRVVLDPIVGLSDGVFMFR